MIQTAFPGDVILSTPIAEALKSRYPGCKTSMVVRPESECLLEDNPFIDNIIVFDKYGSDKGIGGMRRTAAKLRGHHMAVVVQRHLRSALLAYLAGVSKRVGYSNSTGAFLFTKRVKYRRESHEVKRCLDLIGEDDSGLKFRPRIYISEQLSARTNDLLFENGIKYDYAVVAPGSVWSTKRYPYYAALINLIRDKLDMQVVLVGGESDMELAAELSRSAAHLPLNLAGRTNLLQSAAVIARARIAFCNDSAPAHMAAAVGTPVVAIFGPTVPSLGFSPYSENSAVVEIGDLECRPCTKHGSMKCPRGHFKCMIDLSPQRILETARLLLSGRIQNRLC